MNYKALSVITLCVLSFSCTKKPEYPGTERPVSKALEFRIAQAGDYTAPVYDGVQAELKITVSKENHHAGTNTVLWDTTFGMRSLRQYPAITSPLRLTKQFNGIIESKESLRMSRIIRYMNGANNFWTNAKGESIPSLSPLTRFDISL